MTAPARAMGPPYADALHRYLAQPSEVALSDAYELGRAALAEGLGVLEVLGTHHDALRPLLEDTPPAQRAKRLELAASFLSEFLSPYEMTLRGYREANQELRLLNVELGRQKGQLEQLNQELEAFSYSVSHDLRAPLRSVDGFSQALLEDYQERLDEAGRDYLGRIRRSAQFMGELIDGLLALARITREPLTASPVDLSVLARAAAERLAALAPRREVEFRIQEELWGAGDRRLLGVVLENLMGNAWKFTAKAAQACIEFGRTPQGALFVRDNGAGFDMAYAGKLFSPFQRLHAREDFEGHGIGLATVQRVIRRHGGRLWAEARPGEGATFYFTLGEREGGR